MVHGNKHSSRKRSGCVAIGKMLSDEAARAYSTQALNQALSLAQDLSQFFSRARQNFEDKHRFCCFPTFFGLEVLQVLVRFFPSFPSLPMKAPPSPCVWWDHTFSVSFSFFSGELN